MNSNEETSPAKVKLEYKEDEPDNEMNGTNGQTYGTDWSEVNGQSKWFTEPTHLNFNGTRKSDETEPNAIEDYVKSLEKLDNLRSSIDSLREDLELSELRGDLERSRSNLKEQLDLSRSYRLAAEELENVKDEILDTQVWSEAAPPPRLSSSATPYRDHINTLRLRSLRLEEKRLLEIRRLQELERLRGPQPKWYELKTPQFHREARKNNEILAAKKQWNSLRDYTESVWRSRDLSRSAIDL